MTEVKIKKKPGPKGPHGRPLKRTVSFRMYDADTALIKQKTGLSMQQWLDLKIRDEKAREVGDAHLQADFIDD